LTPLHPSLNWGGLEWVLLFVVGAIASGINAVAGGGSLVSFPVLVGLGVPPIQANATNAVGLWPGSLGGALGFLPQLRPTQHHLPVLLLPTAAGASFGAVLLVLSPERVFDFIVPGLIAIAAALLLLQPVIRQYPSTHRTRPLFGVVAQFFVSVYGGYFGAGMGILMLAIFGMFVQGTIHELNAIKTWLSLVINVVASAMFVVMGLVRWNLAIPLILGGILGGFLAARFSQRADSSKLRIAIGVYGLLMAGWFGWRAVHG